MKKVLVFGTFDGLHEGHLDFFRQALRVASLPQGKLQNFKESYLIVVVARDSTVERVKKRLPKFNEQERLKKVQECGLVAEARLGNVAAPGEKFDPYKVIEEVKPDIICLGYDQTHFVDTLAEELPKRGLKIEIKRLKPYKPEQFHSSLLNLNE